MRGLGNWAKHETLEIFFERSMPIFNIYFGKNWFSLKMKNSDKLTTCFTLFYMCIYHLPKLKVKTHASNDHSGNVISYYTTKAAKMYFSEFPYCNFDKLKTFLVSL